MSAEAMRLRVLLPGSEFLQDDAVRIGAESTHGSYVLLPRHIDFAAPLVPGLLTYSRPDGQDRFLAVDEGLLVKVGREVTVATHDAMRGADLDRLRREVATSYKTRSERERRARTALGRLESAFVRHFVHLETSDHA